MKNIIGRVVITGFLLAGVGAPLHAGVIDAPDLVIGSRLYTTFVDDTTGLTWLDLDNFWGSDTIDTVTADLTGSDFHVATDVDLSPLRASIGLVPTGTPWTAMATIVGGNYFGNPAVGVDRELVWGAWDDGGGSLYGWVWQNASGTWRSADNLQNPDQLLWTVNMESRDLGVWVVSNEVLRVPEPSALFLFGLGLVGLGLMPRRRGGSPGRGSAR